MFLSIFSPIIRKIYNIELFLKGNNCDLTTSFNKSKDSVIELENSFIKNSTISVNKKSKLTIGKDSQIINSKIFLTSESNLILGENCKVTNATIKIINQGNLIIKNDSLISSEKPHFEAEIKVNDGYAFFGNNSNIRCKILINHGRMNFGSNSFINHGSEIRCENQINIGSYVFVSYFVDIFDTNTHSLDWKHRMKEVIDGYPNKTLRQSRSVLPETEPVIIGDNVWIGKNVAILKGCKIGSRSIIGTRSVVTKSFPDDSFICGNPAVHKYNIEGSKFIHNIS